MICPKCGFEQPEGLECMRCGIVFSRYKGPVLGEAARPAAVPPPAPPPSASLPPAPKDKSLIHASPEPAMAVAGGGTLYDGPVPALAGGGTIYEGPPPGAPVPMFAVETRPAFRGTFEVGKILGESFSIYFRNFIPFVLLTAVALSPLYLLQAFTTTDAPGSGAPSVTAALLTLLVALVGLICPYIATAAITYGVFQQMRGGDTSIGECLARGLASFLPILILAFVQGIAIFFGMIACIVPGILLALRWAVSVPAAVEEQPGVSGAMSRSTYLTEGYRGEIFLILFVIGILAIGSQVLAFLIAAKDPSLLLLISGVATGLNTGLSATATAVMYYRLRSVKESIDVDQIASVFA